MRDTHPTARQQALTDIRLVLENDRRAYLVIQAEAKRLNVYELGEFIENYVHDSILKAMRMKPSDYTASVGTLLIAQMCFGWGTDIFYQYARDIKAELNDRERTGV
jgi:hypothetical protein